MNIIENVIPLHNAEICVSVDNVSVKNVKIVPRGLDIKISWAGNTVSVIIPCIERHTMLEICY